MGAISATVTLTVASLTNTQILNRLSDEWGYQVTLPNGSANPQTRGDFLKEFIGRFAKNALKAYDSRLAVQAANDAAETAIVVS